MDCFVALATSEPSPTDNDADDIRRREIFLLDLRAGRGAVFRRQQAAFLGEDHPAIAPPVRQHALVVDEIIALLGREDARMRLIERIEKGMVRIAKQTVAEIIGGISPHRQADRVEFAVDGVVIDELVARGLVQPRLRAGEVGDARERELIEGNGGHVVLESSDRPYICLLYTSPSPRDRQKSRMPSSA